MGRRPPRTHRALCPDRISGGCNGRSVAARPRRSAVTLYRGVSSPWRIAAASTGTEISCCRRGPIYSHFPDGRHPPDPGFKCRQKFYRPRYSGQPIVLGQHAGRGWRDPDRRLCLAPRLRIAPDHRLGRRHEPRGGSARLAHLEADPEYARTCYRALACNFLRFGAATEPIPIPALPIRHGGGHGFRLRDCVDAAACDHHR